MAFDFETYTDRSGKDSLAADGRRCLGAGEKCKKELDDVPMWVADMSFATAPSIVLAIQNRLAHPIFGYFTPSDDYYNAIIRWQTTHNGVEGLEKKQIGYANSVLGGLVSAMHVLASPGDAVLLHSPTYVGFTSSLENCGYNIVLSPLVADDQGVFRMDFADMEAKILANNIRVAVLCSPHNPSGRVWEKEELEEAMALFAKHNVFVISDEIWSDLVWASHPHIPTQSVSEDAKNRTVALYAPTKTFNLAGFVSAYRIIYNDDLRAKVEKMESLSHYNQMNVLSMHALLGAYSEEGEAWLCELKEVLQKNLCYASSYIESHFAGVSCPCPEGTYMLFLDCEAYCRQKGMCMDELLQKGWDVGVLWQDGRPFHGDWHIRMNLALPFAKLCEVLERLDRFVF